METANSVEFLRRRYEAETERLRDVDPFSPEYDDVLTDYEEAKRALKAALNTQEAEKPERGQIVFTYCQRDEKARYDRYLGNGWHRVRLCRNGDCWRTRDVRRARAALAEAREGLRAEGGAA